MESGVGDFDPVASLQDPEVEQGAWARRCRVDVTCDQGHPGLTRGRCV